MSFSFPLVSCNFPLDYDVFANSARSLLSFSISTRVFSAFLAKLFSSWFSFYRTAASSLLICSRRVFLRSASGLGEMLELFFLSLLVSWDLMDEFSFNSFATLSFKSWSSFPIVSWEVCKLLRPSWLFLVSYLFFNMSLSCSERASSMALKLASNVDWTRVSCKILSTFIFEAKAETVRVFDYVLVAI